LAKLSLKEHPPRSKRRPLESGFAASLASASALREIRGVIEVKEDTSGSIRPQGWLVISRIS
jgi:hypothetical protein